METPEFSLCLFLHIEGVCASKNDRSRANQGLRTMERSDFEKGCSSGTRRKGGGAMKRRSEAGQTIALVALGMLTFLAAAGLAIDMGYMRYEKRIMQAAADSAAIAAATDRNLGEAGMENADALAVAQANGFQNGVKNTTVTVTHPPVTPGLPVRVQIQRILPSFFMQSLGITTSTVAAAAVATVGTSNGCIYALQVGGAGLTVNALLGINAPSCGVLDNGPLNGPGNITAASLGVFGPFGGYGGASAPGPVEDIAQPAADPLAYLTPPPPAGACIADPMVAAGSVTLTYGTYCSITITGGTASFGPGLYIIDNQNASGNAFQISGTGSAIDTGGVTFYIMGTGAITFSGTGTVSLDASAVDVSTLPQGILFYQDAADTAPADLSMGGTGNANLNGTLYFPGAPLTVAGSLNPNANTPVVAQSITVTGSVVMNADSSLVPGGSPLQTVTLVE
jgi:Flp pilus assembly protein TadG